MYVNDFFRCIFQKKNYTAILYLMLNVLLISAFFFLYMSGSFPDEGLESWAFANRWIYSVLCGIAVYTVSVAIALSPFGEWLLRLQNKCHAIERLTIILNPHLHRLKRKIALQLSFQEPGRYP